MEDLDRINELALKILINYSSYLEELATDVNSQSLFHVDNDG